MAQTPESHTINFNSNSNPVEDISQSQSSNQDAAEGGSQTEITQEVAGDNISQTEITREVAGDNISQTDISNQTAAEVVAGTHIRHMDASFYKAAAEGNMNTLRNMSERYMLDKLTPRRNTILHVAAQFGQLHCVNWILQFRSLSSLLLQPNLKGDTPLHLSAREGHWGVTQVLIKAAKKLPSGSGVGADKTMQRMTNNENDTALHEAVRYNHPDVVKLLILEDPYFIYGANSSGGTPLYMAAERGFHELVQIIIDNTRNLPAHSGLMGRTALHAAVICNNEDMTKKIMGWKKDLTKEVDNNGWSPLHCAAYLGYTSIARQLLEQSDECVVYLRVKNDHNKTALLIAASRGHTEIVKLLVSQYPDCCEQVDDIGNNALHLIMIKKGIYGGSGLLNFPLMSFRGLMNEKNVEGKTPLHLLADYQMFGCGRFIMHKMVDKMVLDKNNSTPLDIMLSAEDTYGEKAPILRRLRNAKGSSGPLGWQKVIEEDIGGRGIKKEEKISLLTEASKTHLVVAALVATVTFANGFKLPDVYNEMKGKDRGITILAAPPPDGHKDGMRWASESQANFDAYYYADLLAALLSFAAILLYFLMAMCNKYLRFKRTVNFVNKVSLAGFILTYCGLTMMIYAFLLGMRSVK